MSLATEPTSDFSKVDPWAEAWAIGSPQWQTDLARRHLVFAGARDVRSADLRRIKEARWQHVLTEALAVAAKSHGDIVRDAKGAAWKIEIARQLRAAQAPHPWISTALNMGAPSSVRVYLARKLTSSGLTP